MGTGSGFGGTVASGGGFWGSGDGYGDRWCLWGHGGFGDTLVVPGGGSGGVRRWLWGQVVALGTGSGYGAQWPHVVALGGSEDGYGDRQWLWGHGGFGDTLVAPGGGFGGQEMAMGTGGGFGGTLVAPGGGFWGSGDGYGDRWWLWGHLGGPMWWLWGGRKMAMGTGGGFGGTVALGMGRLWVQGGFEDGWRHNPG